jgi:hypothetical protein
VFGEPGIEYDPRLDKIEVNIQKKKKGRFMVCSPILKRSIPYIQMAPSFPSPLPLAG